MNSYIKTPVLVPAERLTEFYKFYSDWLLGAAPTAVASTAANGDLWEWTGVTDDDDEIAAARVIWNKLSDRGKALFEYLARQPDVRFTASDLADHLDIPNGMYGVAGVLAWPARHAQAVGYHLPIRFEPGPSGEGAAYWMSTQAADIFTAVMND